VRVAGAHDRECSRHWRTVMVESKREELLARHDEVELMPSLEGSEGNLMPLWINIARGGNVRVARRLCAILANDLATGKVPGESLSAYFSEALNAIARDADPNRALYLTRKPGHPKAKSQLDRNQWIYHRMEDLIGAGLSKRRASEAIEEGTQDWLGLTDRSIRRIYAEMEEALHPPE
jgi:hypothetical protein